MCFSSLGFFHGIARRPAALPKARPYRPFLAAFLVPQNRIHQQRTTACAPSSMEAPVIAILDSDDEEQEGSKPKRPITCRTLADGCIEILDSDDENTENNLKLPPINSDKQGSKSESLENASSNVQHTTIPNVPGAWRSLRPAAVQDNDEEVELLGFTGMNALEDFPHARENCVQCPFATGRQQRHCSNCFWYVRLVDTRTANDHTV